MTTTRAHKLIDNVGSSVPETLERLLVSKRARVCKPNILSWIFTCEELTAPSDTGGLADADSDTNIALLLANMKMRLPNMWLRLRSRRLSMLCPWACMPLAAVSTEQNWGTNWVVLVILRLLHDCAGMQSSVSCATSALPSDTKG